MVWQFRGLIFVLWLIDPKLASNFASNGIITVRKILWSFSSQALAVSVKWSKGVEVGALITARCDLNGLVPSTFADARQVWGKLKASGAPVAAAGQPVWPISLSRP